jgi:hypothetical protein
LAEEVADNVLLAGRPSFMVIGCLTAPRSMFMRPSAHNKKLQQRAQDTTRTEVQRGWSEETRVRPQDPNCPLCHPISTLWG